MELTENLYSYIYQGQGNNCNTYALKYMVDGKHHVALIDPGHTVVQAPAFDERTGRVTGYYEVDALKDLLKAMEKDGLKLSDLGLIIFTHCHPDHFQAGIALAGMSEAKVAFHELELPTFQRITEQASRETNRWPSFENTASGSGRSQSTAPTSNGGVLPDFFLKEAELALGRSAPVVIDVLHAPGHSAGSICLYWREKKALFAGDVVFYRNTGRYDLPGGSRSVLRESIVKLSHLDTEYLLTGHPYGHPGVITGKKNVEQNFSFILTHVLS